ncbi:MAG: hypothetical protein RRY40_01130, partial [Oscillospiraceae bacterium]
MIKSRLKYLFLLLAVAVFITACQKSPQKDTSTVSPPTAKSKISFTDDDGNEINADAPFKKIISRYSAHTENLFELGVGDSVIGGHTTCVYPPEAAFLEKFDYNADPETDIAAAPDLVLI